MENKKLKVIVHYSIRSYNKISTFTTELSSMKHYSFFIFLLTLFIPWLVSQEATLLFPVSSGMDGGFCSSVPFTDALNSSLLSWLPGAGRREASVRRQNWYFLKKLVHLLILYQKDYLTYITYITSLTSMTSTFLHKHLRFLVTFSVNVDFCPPSNRLTFLVALDLTTCCVTPPHRAGVEVVVLYKRVVRTVTFIFTLGVFLFFFIAFCWWARALGCDRKNKHQVKNLV